MEKETVDAGPVGAVGVCIAGVSDVTSAGHKVVHGDALAGEELPHAGYLHRRLAVHHN